MKTTNVERPRGKNSIIGNIEFGIIPTNIIDHLDVNKKQNAYNPFIL